MAQLQSLRCWPLIAQSQNQSKVTAGEMCNERNGNGTGFSLSLFSFTLLIINLTLLHNQKAWLLQDMQCPYTRQHTTTSPIIISDPALGQFQTKKVLRYFYQCFHMQKLHCAIKTVTAITKQIESCTVFNPKLLQHVITLLNIHTINMLHQSNYLTITIQKQGI